MLKTSRHIFLLTIVAFTMAFISPQKKRDSVAPAKWALIIAVGKYPESSGWERLSSLNDVRILQDALIRQGFAEGNIAIVSDEQATRTGILDAIQQHLMEKAKPGDVAVFHFSGHGQQVQDDNADEVDGFDEAIVPFDSPKHYQSGVYEGHNLIRDEELGAALRALRNKIGPTGHLLTLIDACHSGTATRGLAKARGTDQRMASPSYLAAHTDKLGEEGSLETGDAPGLAPMVALFSASPHQLSYEYVDEQGEGFGILSYTFSKAFCTAKEGLSYRAIFDQIRVQMSALSPRQAPQAEGPLDEAVLGGQIKGSPRYFLPLEWIDGQTLRLSAGTLAGLHEGTVVAIYPIGTVDTLGASLVAFGKIVGSSLFDCDVELAKSIPKSSRSCQVFIREQNYGSLSASLKLDVTNSDLAAALRELPADCPAIQLVAINPELVIREQRDEVQLLTKDDYLLGSFKLPTSGNYRGLARQLRQQVVAFAQAKFLRPLEMADNRLGLSLEFIGKDGQPLQSNQLQLGTELRLRIRNTGTASCYFSLLDIQPDNLLNIIIPAGKPAVDYYLAPGNHYDYPEPVEVSEPVGTEVLKLIASEQPLDLTNIVATRGGVSGQGKPQGGKHPLEVLLRQTYLREGTRGQTGNLPGGGVAVGSVVVGIQK